MVIRAHQDPGKHGSCPLTERCTRRTPSTRFEIALSGSEMFSRCNSLAQLVSAQLPVPMSLPRTT